MHFDSARMASTEDDLPAIDSIQETSVAIHKALCVDRF